MLEYIERVASARTIEELWALHCETMAGYGFDRLLYGFTRFRTARSLGDLEDFLILTNMDDSYTEGFLKGGLYLHAPMVRWAVENAGACSWSWIARHADALTEAEKRVVAFNLSHGVSVGYSISFLEMSPRARGAIALIAQDGMSQAEADALWAEVGRKITAMNQVAHLRIVNLPYKVARKTLTRRQREALEWVGEGKTNQDIATIMGLTAATVEKHLRLAREALDVETTAQAVLKASFQNQIFLLEA